MLSQSVKKVILTFLKDEVVVLSWGISNIVITDSYIAFEVNGLNYKGDVKVESYDSEIYSICIGNIKRYFCKLDEVVKLIDLEIEYVPNYVSKVSLWLNSTISRRY